MQQKFIKKEHHPRLLLFFAGWGSDERLFNRPVAEGYDCLICFDYRLPDFDHALLEGYREVRLLAWSMGVWVAGQVLAGYNYPWEMKLAVNGTPYPVDDRRGIPEAVFRKTLECFDGNGLARFRRRICGTADRTKEFLSHHPYRPVEELHAELAALWRSVHLLPPSGFGWDRAIVGTCDKIFPPANQCEAWKGVEVEERETEHYDGSLFDRLLSGEDEVWTRH